MCRSVASERQLVINHSPYYPVQLFFSGPAIVLILLSVLSTLALLTAFLGRSSWLMQLAEQGAQRLEGGRAVPALWGLAATLFCLLAAAVLFSTKILALLGLLILASGLTVAGLGLGAVAVWLGRRISEAAGLSETKMLICLRLGLGTLLLASLLPYAGWLLVLLSLAMGVGAVLELLTERGIRYKGGNH